MSGLKNTAGRIWQAGKGQGYKTKHERNLENTAKVTDAKNKMFGEATLPDDEVIKRNERRKSAKRRGSRVNTVLTDRESLG